MTDVPGTVAVIGGSAGGVELGQFLGRMGARVTILEPAERLVAREHPRAGDLASDALEADGIDVRTGVEVRRVLRAGSKTTVELEGALASTPT